MKRLPCKTVTQLLNEGIDIRNATLIVLSDLHYYFTYGELVRMDKDDGTYNPVFVSIKKYGSTAPEDLHYVNMERLGIYDPNNHEHVALRAKLRLKGAL